MVTRRNAMQKNTRRTIRRSLGRYIAIVAIIALGAGIFVGLVGTKTDMVATAQHYTDEQDMFDLRLLSTYGWSAEDVEAVQAMDGVADAEGSIFLDVIGGYDGADKEVVYRLHAIPERINKVYLLGGRMPQAADEILVDGSNADDSVLGKTFTISSGNEEATLESLTTTTFTVVGYVSTPLYMDMSRGSTTLGNGSLEGYIYVPQDAFDMDYYTEIAVTIHGDYAVYSDAFTAAMERMAEQLEPAVTVLAQDRYITLRDEAQTEYQDGLKEYEDGLAEYETGRQEALDELAQALAELEDGQAQLDEQWAALEEGRQQIQEGQAQIDQGRQTLEQSKTDLLNGKVEAYDQLLQAHRALQENEKTVNDSLTQVQDGLVQLDDGIAQLEDGLSQLEEGLQMVELVVSALEISRDVLSDQLEAAQSAPVVDEILVDLLQEQLDQVEVKLAEYTAQKADLEDQLQTYTAQLEDLKVQRQELAQTEQTLLDAQEEIQAGYDQIGRKQEELDLQFASADAQIQAGEQELDQSQQTLDEKLQELEAGQTALEDAQKELDQGWTEYEEGKAQAEEELSQAEAELADAKVQLDDAKAQIDDMTDPEVYLLDRNTNVGYLAVDSNSDIVAGVSRVFPAFFLLVAALVCLTTLTRMIEEERTQIGILKALGYGNRTIIGKYLFYTGSAALVGCGVGVVVGSVVFPIILWHAYSIVLNLTPHIQLVLNWPLCLGVVAAYTALSMLVTWYCCRRTLAEVPAQLIRPKAPTPGKKIWMEHLPFWGKISFLNKVMFRNVFRYKQRLMMMLVGIGGCTALLLTGFGIGDSIQDINDYQFREVTTYDIQVYFSEDQDQQAQDTFCQAVDAQSILFYHQSTVDLEFDDKTSEVNLLAAGDQIRDHMDLHNGQEALGMPGLGQAYISTGVAEAMDVQVGDTITIRNADMQTVQLEVTGVFENYVYNYVLLRPESLEQAWGETPAQQMAFVTLREDQDAHAVGVSISEQAGVMNVSISQDLADQVGSMLEVLDMIVATVVVCAGMLAVIVLYNLTNISITERIREIATIKVLGFTSKETAAYVFKENLLLTAMGMVVGLGGGVLLLQFVMSQIKVDMVWFLTRLDWTSFLWAMVLTMLLACLVDFLLYFKLERIDMADALKSVE